jgi:NAD+ synthase
MIALAQLNLTIGDIAGNVARIRSARAQGAMAGADVVITPELSLCGYPPEDLLLRPRFIDACLAACQELAADTKDGGPGIIVGLPWQGGTGLYNTVAYLDHGRIVAVRAKVDLPNYGVFDEKRWFQAGALPDPILVRGVSVGLVICEDLWTPAAAEYVVSQGAQLIVSPNASPYWRGKPEERRNVIAQRSRETNVPIVYLSCVGGQDELVFDGDSLIMPVDSPDPVVALPQFQVASPTLRFRFEDGKSSIDAVSPAPTLTPDQQDYSACVLGLRDYIRKNGFRQVLLGLSGGIDSALCAAMAVDALGAAQVSAIMLPYRYTSLQSRQDAQTCAKALGVAYRVLDIEAGVDGLLTTLHHGIDGVALENLQSRVRGTVLMALSNQTGALLLTTGNKSEMATGYATLYGDMNGAFNPLKDLYKTKVYALSRLRNTWRPFDALGPVGAVIPESILTRPASAELRPNQTDQDSLPDYAVLDAILEMFIGKNMSQQEVFAAGFEAPTVAQVAKLLARTEYKRQQAPLGVKLTERAFGKDWRLPVTHGFEF